MVVERVPRMAHKDDDSDSGHEQDGKTQVQSDSSEEGFVIPAWRLHMPVHCGNFVTKTPMLGSRSDWAPGHVHAPDWRGNNNTLGEWGKCFTGEEGALPQHLADTFTNTSLKMLTAQQPEITEKIHADAGYSSPKEDGRKSSEHTNSYDVSASQSPSNDGGQSDSASDEQIDVECMTQTDEMETDEKEETMQEPEIEVDNEVKTPVPAPLPAPIAIVPVLNGERKPTIEEALLLSLQQHQFQEVIAEAAKIRKASAAESLGFVRSGTSAFSNIEPKEAARPPSVPSATPIDTPTPTVTFSTNSSTPTSASFCRPPGLGPVALPPVQNGQTPQLVCPICGFMCPSKFHFNSHMNTHGDHQCSMCDYTSRTEGRLKKHMRESHTQEEQLRAGLELEPVKETNGSNSSPKGVTPSKENGASSPITEPFNLSTTMASILDSTNNAIAAISHTDLPSSLPTALNLDITSTPTLLSTLSQTSIPSSALDQIKAFAENTNLMPENGISLASALGAVSQAMKGEPASPEKQSNGESRRSSSGKMKILKCKQCGHHSMSKDEQWAHARTHIPTEKQLNCQHCNFVTEYKHHLEYHYRNHIGSKPFQCKKCSYTCVNKSMLNSHMKSHTNHYQFRCMDCTYATKYCHSLKLHLKKYNHRRVPEGIDLSGGDTSPSLSVSDATISFSPSLVKQEIKSEPVEPVTPIAQPFSFNPMVGGQGLNLANQFFMSKHLDGGFMGMSGLRNGPVPSFKCPVCDVVCSSQEEQMRHSMSHILNTSAVPTTIASLYSSLNLPTLNIKPEPEDVEPIEVDVKIEDDSSESHAAEEEMMDHSSDLTASPAGSSQTASSGDEDTKKCKTMSMEQLSQRLRGNSPMSTDSAVVRDEESADDDAHSPCDTATSASSPPQNNVSIVAPIPIAPAPDHSMLQALIQQATMAMAFHANRNAMFTCHHCNINFGNQPAYTSHMAAHSFESPFKCNKCGHISTDSLSFALHQFQLCRM